MSSISRDEIKAYVDHVRKNDFSPFTFPDSWWMLPAHSDSREGIKQLQVQGYKCVTLSNGSVELLHSVSERNGIQWDYVTNLVAAKVYKPNEGAYLEVQRNLSFDPKETLMVTANPTFGDIEGASGIGMPSMVIRCPNTPQTITELAALIGSFTTPKHYESILAVASRLRWELHGFRELFDGSDPTSEKAITDYDKLIHSCKE